MRGLLVNAGGSRPEPSAASNSTSTRELYTREDRYQGYDVFEKSVEYLDRDGTIDSKGKPTKVLLNGELTVKVPRAPRDVTV